MQTEEMATKTRIAAENAGIHSLVRRMMAPFLFALVLAAVCFAGAVPAMADDLGLIPLEEQPYLINPSAPGVDTLEAFMETPGTSFGAPGFIDLAPGWNYIDINEDYSSEYGPTSTALPEDLEFVGNSSFVADFYGFTGCAGLQPITACPVGDLTDAYAVHFTNGVYQYWTPLTADNLYGENTSTGEVYTASTSDEGGSATPEPRTAMLIGGALLALCAWRRKPYAL